MSWEPSPVSKLASFSSLLLRSPLLWGGALSFAFFALIHGGVITNPLVLRYLAGHWVEYVETALFCVGLAFLALHAADLVRQRRRMGDPLLADAPEGGADPAEATALAATISAEATGYLPRRLREALDLVIRTGSADELENHLKYLSDLDAARASQGYGLVRFVIWAIPIMGFLGTVIGITEAIACLSPTQLDNISGVVAGLGTAFDTTATALALSMVLMFIQFMIDRYEQGLLAEVDDAAWTALAGRFQALGGGDGAALAVARLGETLGRGTARLLEAQEQAWASLERTAAAGVRQLLDEAGGAIGQSLTTALDRSLATWAESFVRTQDELAARREDRWVEAAASLAAAVRGLEARHESIERQTAAIAGVVEATRDVAALERSLDANLATLTTTGRFEETLTTLAAAVQLLAARAADQNRDVHAIRRPGKAA
ncbi:MAG: MotA/TolQ/ExbB proton channel family protein [Planctomycetes bacterium]|nr:MotA/TolQ/ExbB proton channel family protein [Planctomycetota bacterium]